MLRHSLIDAFDIDPPPSQLLLDHTDDLQSQPIVPITQRYSVSAILASLLTRTFLESFSPLASFVGHVGHQPAAGEG